MKKPNPKAAAVNVINATIRGGVQIDKIRMIILERKHIQELQKARIRKECEKLMDDRAVRIAQKIIDDRISSGHYDAGSYDLAADLRLEIAFAKIAVRNS